MRSFFTRAVGKVVGLSPEQFRVAARDGDLEVVRQYLQQFTGEALLAAINASGKLVAGYSQINYEVNHNNALALAAAYGRLEVVKLLILNGANVNEKSASGEVPLTASCMYPDMQIERRIEIIEALLKKGALKESTNKDGATARVLAKGISQECGDEVDKLFNPPEYQAQTDEEKKSETDFRIRVEAVDAEFKDEMICPVTQQIIFDPVLPVYAPAETKEAEATRAIAEQKAHHYERMAIVEWLKSKQTDPMNPGFVIVGLKRDPEFKMQIEAALGSQEAQVTVTRAGGAAETKQETVAAVEETKAAPSSVSIHIPTSPGSSINAPQALFSGSQTPTAPPAQTPAPVQQEPERTPSRSRSPSGRGDSR
jgi:hypothetical protein